MKAGMRLVEGTNAVRLTAPARSWSAGQFELLAALSDICFLTPFTNVFFRQTPRASSMPSAEIAW